MLIMLFASLFVLAKPVEAVDVDLERYTGKWYEIGRYGLFFEQGMANVTAEYTLLDNGEIQVVNQGFYGGPGGLKGSVKGKAWVPDPEETGKLKVQFFGAFSSDYWVIDLDEEDYSYAVVSQPEKEYLWILSRTPQMDDALYEEILTRLNNWGFDLNRIEKVTQEW